MQVLSRNAASRPAQQTASTGASRPGSPAEPLHSQGQAEGPIAFLCSLQKEDMLILAVDCSGHSERAALFQHPAVKELAEHQSGYVLPICQ